MKFSLNIGLLFFWQGYSEMKMTRNNRGVLEDFKGNRREKQEKEKKKRKKKKKYKFFSLIEKNHKNI